MGYNARTKQDGIEEERKKGRTSHKNTSPSTKFENSDEPSFLSSIVDGLAHADVEGVHGEHTGEHALSSQKNPPYQDSRRGRRRG